MVLIEIKKAVKEERKYFEKILDYLEIIELKKLFIPEYDNLFNYCRKELGYTDSEAQRRIDAMRTLKRHPVMKEMIANEELSLSQLGLLGRIEMEASRENLKLDMNQILPEVLNKTVKETEEIARKAANLPPKKHKIMIEVNEESYKKWKEYRNQNHLKSTEAIITDLIDTKLNSQKTPKKLVKTSQKTRGGSEAFRETCFERANYKCQAVGCSNTLHLELDHIIPVALGGKTTLENCRILCHAHNLARNLGFFV